MSRFEEVILKGIIDDNNSYDSSVSGGLGIGGVFTGTSTEIKDCGVVFVNTFSDQASATDGLSIQQSPDGTNWNHTDEYTVAANSGKNFSLNPHSQYYRVVYTNGAVAQTVFRLQSICKTGNAKPSSHRIKDEIIGDDDCTLVKAAITGENGDGDWHNVKTTADGYLSVSDRSSGLAIAEGDVTGKSFIHKFGEAPDFDQTDGAVTVWGGANDGLLGGGAMTYTYSSTADIGLITSSNAGDTQTIEIQGLDSNFDLVTQTITLNGQTDVDISATGVDLIRAFRMKNTGSTDLAGVVYLRTNGSAQNGSGVPTVANTVRAIINNGDNQTLMSIFTVPNATTGYMRDWYASTAGATRTSEYKLRLRARPVNGVFQIKHVSSISDAGSSTYKHQYIEPEVFQAKTDIELTAEMLTTAATQADIAGGFDIVLVDD
jgi:hypothetical protein